MSTVIEKALIQTESKKKSIEKDPSVYFYPNLSDAQKDGIQKVQEVLDKRFKERKSLEEIDLKVLFDPEHEKFQTVYALKDIQKEELIQLIRYRV